MKTTLERYFFFWYPSRFPSEEEDEMEEEGRWREGRRGQLELVRVPPSSPEVQDCQSLPLNFPLICASSLLTRFSSSSLGTEEGGEGAKEGEGEGAQDGKDVGQHGF